MNIPKIDNLIKLLQDLKTLDCENIIVKGRIPSKKNSKQISSKKSGDKFVPTIVSSAQHQNWIKLIRLLMLQKYKKLIKKSFKNIAFINLKFGFGDLRGSDLTNKAESVMDMLCDKQLKIIEDDNYFVMSKVYLEGVYVPSGEFYCEIDIYYDKNDQVCKKPIKVKKSRKKASKKSTEPKHLDFKLD